MVIAFSHTLYSVVKQEKAEYPNQERGNRPGQLEEMVGSVSSLVALSDIDYTQI